VLLLDRGLSELFLLSAFYFSYVRLALVARSAHVTTLELNASLSASLSASASWPTL